jgi:hypothetical protein
MATRPATYVQASVVLPNEQAPDPAALTAAFDQALAAVSAALQGQDAPGWLSPVQGPHAQDAGAQYTRYALELLDPDSAAAHAWPGQLAAALRVAVHAQGYTVVDAFALTVPDYLATEAAGKALSPDATAPGIAAPPSVWPLRLGAALVGVGLVAPFLIPGSSEALHR